MSTYFEFWTEETMEIATQEFNWKLSEAFDQNEYHNTGTFIPITFVEDTAMAIFIFLLGNLLNIIILRSYWREKSATSTYIRAFAVIDMLSVALMLTRRVFLFAWANQIDVIFVNDVLSTLFGGLYNFGPMFLAMDRCLVVAFPYNFREKEGKLRAAKGCMILAFTMMGLALSILYRFGDSVSTAITFLGMLAGFVSLLQIFVIIVLYAAIVVKVLKSDRKMKDSRHFGKM